MHNKVVKIVGIPGMCSDDGRALTYGYNLYLNNYGGRGFYENARYFGGDDGNIKAREYAETNGYRIELEAVT